MTLPSLPPTSSMKEQIATLEKMCEDRQRYKEEVKFWYEFTTTPRTRFRIRLLRSAAQELELKYSSETSGRVIKTHKFVFVGEARYVKVLIESINAWS